MNVGENRQRRVALGLLGAGIVILLSISLLEISRRHESEAVDPRVAPAAATSDAAATFASSSAPTPTASVDAANAFDPALANSPLPGPEHALAACATSITNCMVRTRDVDACVRTIPRCQSATPWAGDPAGEGCCPVACARAYEAKRAAGAAVADAIDAMFETECHRK